MTIAYGDIYVTAAMTAADAPSGDASASDELSASYPAWEAFTQGNNLSDAICWISDDTTVVSEEYPRWLKYHFDAPVTVAAFKFKPRYSSTSWHYPSDFILQGSNNDSDWDDLLTVSGYEDITAYTINSDLFILSSTGSYSYYRIYITAQYPLGHDWVSIGELELYGQYYVATPYMTNYTVPSGIVSANGEYSANYRAWEPFSGGRTNNFCWLAPAVAPSVESPHWLKYQFASAQTIVAYAWRTRNDAARNFPSDFKLQGSNNDSDWDDLHSVSSLSDPGQDTLTAIYNVSSPASYIYYRLLITGMTKVGSTSNWTAINDFLLIKAMPVSEGWTGKICGVTNPSKICGVAVANISKVSGV